MLLKIKWNDDRVRGATTAILLIGRARLARGQTENLIADALAEVKALKISRQHPGALVLGADSVVVTADGAMIAKPEIAAMI